MSSKKTLFLSVLFVAIAMSLTVPVHAETTPLSDIDSAHKNFEAISYLKENGVISGYADGTFKPNKTVTRAELAKILVAGKGMTPDSTQYSNCFTDVKTQWFAPYVCYAKEQNWVAGYTNGRFKPENTVNKVEAIKMLVSSQGYELPTEVTESLFSDVDSKAWYAPYVKVAKTKGLLEETDINLSPLSLMNRAGVSENIYRAIIIANNSLNSYTEYNLDNVLIDSTKNTASTPTPTNLGENPISGEKSILESMSVQELPSNYDSDAENDGLKIEVLFTNSDGNLTYPKAEDWTLDVKIYESLWDTGNGLKNKKGILLFSKSYGKDDVKYDILHLPWVRADYDNFKNSDEKYGWFEVTATSATYGTFSAKDEFATLHL